MAPDPDPTPEDRFRAWLAERETAGAFVRPRRLLVEAVVLGGGLAFWALLGWLLLWLLDIV